MTAPDSDALARLLRPRSIAVLGASDNPSKVSGRPLANLLRYGYRGRILPVNPNRRSEGLLAVDALATLRSGERQAQS